MNLPSQSLLDLIKTDGAVFALTMSYSAVPGLRPTLAFSRLGVPLPTAVIAFRRRLPEGSASP